jgi:hippurate hydrolase
VKQKLTEWGIPFKDGIATTGIVATITGQKSDSGKAIALRADMDALDIPEKTGLPHASEFEGKMHACGHDGHTATLLGAARYLNETRNFNGTVHLIFQPAEEGGNGAHKMIEEGVLKEFPCDFVFGIHNWPWLETGKAAMRVGPLLASVDEFWITISGKGGHAAMPHATVDPLVCASQLVTALQTIVSRNADPVDTAVLSVTNLNAGTGAFNIIADTAKLHGTVRTFSNAMRDMIERRMREMTEKFCAAFGATAELVYNRQCDPTVNSADGVEMAAKAMAEIVGEANIIRDAPPSMGGEDFGAFLAQKPGAFIFVGQGTGKKDSPHDQGLHSPHYDFNDEILPIGGSFFAKLAEQYMPLHK